MSIPCPRPWRSHLQNDRILFSLRAHGFFSIDDLSIPLQLYFQGSVYLNTTHRPGKRHSLTSIGSEEPAAIATRRLVADINAESELSGRGWESRGFEKNAAGENPYMSERFTESTITAINGVRSEGTPLRDEMDNQRDIRD